MSFNRITSLLSRFGKIENAIDRERDAARPDWLRLVHLRKIRQAIKQQIFNLTRQDLAQRMPALAYVRVQPPRGPVRR